jgi:hypothetical protein
LQIKKSNVSVVPTPFLKKIKNKNNAIVDASG